MSTIAELLPSYRRHLESQAKAYQTVRAYLGALASFEQHYTGDVADIKRRHIEAWLIDRQGSVSGTTLNSHWGWLRIFLRWAIDEQELSHDPTDKMKAPKTSIIAPEVYTQTDYRRLLETARKHPIRFLAIRNVAMLALLWECGLRRSEMVSVRLDNLDLDARTITLISAKSHKPRTVAFSKEVTAYLDRYVRIRSKQHYAYLPTLFIGEHGSLTGNGLYRVLRMLQEKAGFDRTIRPHIFRHSWANEMLKAGMTPLDVCVLAGWSNLSMLRTYGASQMTERAVDSHKRVLDNFNSSAKFAARS